MTCNKLFFIADKQLLCFSVAALISASEQSSAELPDSIIVLKKIKEQMSKLESIFLSLLRRQLQATDAFVTK